MSTGGIILCGGHSTRMGQPKPWLQFGTELLLPRMVRLVSAAVQPVVVVAAAGQELPALPTRTIVIRDTVPDEGPLCGLATGLAALSGLSETAYVTGCDCPFLQEGFVTRMAELLGNHAATVPLIEHQVYPLAAVYRCNLATDALRLLGQRQRAMRDLLATISVRYVGPSECYDVDPDLLSLRNLNTPDAYNEALRLLETLK
jgi:molybdenum cofactor guanylyltransferase